MTAGPGPGRVLGLDPGEATIGVALSDALRLTAQPLEPLKRVGARQDVERLAQLIREREVAEVVIGLPLQLSGAEGHAARGARELAGRLRARVPPEVEIELWDERLTTVQAERMLIEGDVRRSRRKQVIDTVAAVLILQNYLDAKRDHDERSSR